MTRLDATGLAALLRPRIALLVLAVTATGSQWRREIGNSIARVETSALAEVAPVTSLQELLQARAPGVVILPSSGSVGSGSRIRIRGISSATLSAG